MPTDVNVTQAGKPTEAPPNPVAANVPSGFPIIPEAGNPGQPFVGPVDTTGVYSPQGMTGKQRFDYVMSHAPSGMSAQGGHDFNSWIMSVPEDVNDLEYTRLLRQEKNNARLREQQRASGDATNIGAPSKPFAGGPNDKVVKLDNKSGGDGTVVPGIQGQLTNAGRIDRMEQQQTKQQEAHRKRTTGKPLVMGLPVTPESVLGDPENPSGSPSPWVDQFAKGQAIDVQDQYAQAATRSGFWVYQGQVADPAGGPGYTRDVYVYVDDAQAQLAAMPQDKIKGYQKKLGLEVNGLADPLLQNIWDQAVKIAANYARSGKKVELQFIFDQLVAVKAASGSGGGGGGSGLEKNPNDMAAADYYAGMQQILGDISGVGGRNG